VGTLWVVGEGRRKFNGGHARLLEEFSGFAGIALGMIKAEKDLAAAMAQQELVTKEMSHRVKNLFTLMQGMVSLTARNSATPAEMAQTLSGRVQALSIAHDLARRASAQDSAAIGLEDLMRTILLPHGGKQRFVGEPISVSRRSASDLALVLHELATNAAKYGSLSQDGAVDITWSTDDTHIHVTWSELDGPEIGEAPVAKGFGLSLTENTLAGPLGGEIEYSWKRHGLQVKMKMPLAALDH
jgi:two-component sensor histidine kinase